MGDYYKIKKILLILLIVSVIFRIINQTKVFATEAVEVTPVWNDGTYTYQSDNQYLTLRQNQLDIQEAFINCLYNLYFLEYTTPTIKANTLSFVNTIKQYLTSSYPTGSGYGGTGTRFIWFGRNLSPINGSNNYGYFIQCFRGNDLANVTYADATLNSGYKLLSVPFYSINRANNSGYNYCRYFSTYDGSYISVTTGTALVPCAEVGCYSTRWFDLFVDFGLLTESEYTDALNNIQGTLTEMSGDVYAASYYAEETSNIVGNTYDFIVDDDIDDYSSLGISQPNITSQIDLTSVFDEVEILLTDEDYTSKAFTFSLPGNRNYNFSLNPNILETNLTRVGGSGIIEIIHACWYIALFGWYIFAYLRIFSKLISGDWLHLVGGTSPTNKLVKISVGSITGGGY